MGVLKDIRRLLTMIYEQRILEPKVVSNPEFQKPKVADETDPLGLNDIQVSPILNWAFPDEPIYIQASAGTSGEAKGKEQEPPNEVEEKVAGEE